MFLFLQKFQVKHYELSDVICALLFMLRKVRFTETSLEVLGGMTTVQKLNTCYKKLYNRTR